MKRYQYRMTLHELCDRLNKELDAIRALESELEKHQNGTSTGVCSVHMTAGYLHSHRNEYRRLEKRAARRKDYRRVVLGQ